MLRLHNFSLSKGHDRVEFRPPETFGSCGKCPNYISQGALCRKFKNEPRLLTVHASSFFVPSHLALPDRLYLERLASLLCCVKMEALDTKWKEAIRHSPLLPWSHLTSFPLSLFVSAPNGGKSCEKQTRKHDEDGLNTCDLLEANNLRKPEDEKGYKAALSKQIPFSV